MSTQPIIYPVLCSGHTGSRLLVRLMMANGVYMGAKRSPVGEDEEYFGQMLWNPAFQRTFTVHWKYPEDKRNLDAMKKDIYQTHQRFIVGMSSMKTPTKVVGFKSATLFPYVAKEYRELMEENGIRTRFIHLVRHPLQWMLSGRDPKSHGIQRPSHQLNFSRLSDPFIRLVWFNSLADQAVWKNRRVTLSDYEIYSEEDQVMIESMLWCTTNELSASFADHPEDYLLISYEDLILNTPSVLEKISQFLEIPFTQHESVPINPDRMVKDPRDKLSAESVDTTLAICGDLMKRLGIPEEPPLAKQKLSSVG